MRLCRCGEEISPGRLRLGLNCCLTCGEKEAQIEIKAKQKRVAPDYNKGGYVYQGDAATARRNILQAGKKNASLEVTINLPTSPLPELKIAPAVENELITRKAIGIYYIGQEAYTWYSDLADPKVKGATRQVRLRS